jgi:hypothetical protein
VALTSTAEALPLQMQILHAKAESERQCIEAEDLKIAIQTVAQGIRVESGGGCQSIQGGRSDRTIYKFDPLHGNPS